MEGRTLGEGTGGPLPSATGPGGEPLWDLDVDAFLDDYLKQAVPEGPDPFAAYGPDLALANGVGETSGVKREEDATPAPPRSEAGDASEHIGEAPISEPAEPAGGRAPAGARKEPTGKARSTTSAGARADSADKGIKKQLALQEKNRRAQRRFRERQKQKVAELEDQVAQLTAQLQRAAADKAEAEQHAKAVEEALQLALAQAHGSGGDPSAGLGEGIAALGGVTRVGVAGGKVAAGGRGGEGEEEVAIPVVFNDVLTLTLREGSTTRLSAAQLRSMTPAELARYYRAYVNEMAARLVEGGAGGGGGGPVPAASSAGAGAVGADGGQPPSDPGVDRLVDELCLLWTRVALCNAAGAKHFALTRVEPSAAPGGDERVSHVSRALHITPAQRRHLCHLRALFLQKLSRIAQERAEVAEQLARSTPNGTGARKLSALYLSSHDAARRLRELLREEHVLQLDFESTVFKHVLSRHQVAQFMIHSFPWTPDCLELATWVAAEDGDADALSMLALEAQHRAAMAAAAASSGMPGNMGGQAMSGMAMGATPAMSGMQQQQPSMSGMQQQQPSMSGMQQQQPSMSGMQQQQPSMSGMQQQQPSMSGMQQQQQQARGMNGLHQGGQHQAQGAMPGMQQSPVLGGGMGTMGGGMGGMMPGMMPGMLPGSAGMLPPGMGGMQMGGMLPAGLGGLGGPPQMGSSPSGPSGLGLPQQAQGASSRGQVGGAGGGGVDASQNEVGSAYGGAGGGGGEGAGAGGLPGYGDGQLHQALSAGGQGQLGDSFSTFTSPQGGGGQTPFSGNLQTSAVSISSTH